MTKNTKAGKTKFLFTLVQITIFLGILVYADAFEGTSQEVTPTINEQLFLSQEDKKIGINIEQIVQVNEEEDWNTLSYVVQEGDTIESISKEFGVPVADLKKLNKLKNNIKIGQRLIVSNNEEGLLYIVKQKRTLKLFAEYYRLNIDDLLTLNHFSDDSEILYPGQEIFVNITEQRAYDIGLLEKAQPILPKDEVPVKKQQPAVKRWVKNGNTTQIINSNGTISTSKIITQRPYNPKISNGFAIGYCTRYVAMKVPSIFPYISESKQERPFGGNAKDWYRNAQNAGFAVGQAPREGAIIVYEQLRSPAGHVGIVKKYHPDLGQMIIEDMNYVGKYVVTQRRESVNRKEIIGYIYP